MESEHQKPLIGAYLILKTKEGILLSQRGRGQFKGYYSLVAGHTDVGESVIDAIVREANEEAGIILNPNELQVVFVVHRPQADYKGIKTDIIDFFIQAETYTGDIQNKEPEKCSDLRFFAEQSLPANLLPHVKTVLSSSIQNSFYSCIKDKQ